MLKLKIQYSHYETGEFTEEQPVDESTLLRIFKEHTELIETPHSFTIKRAFVTFYITNENHYLRIMHFAKNAFVVEYMNTTDNIPHMGNFYINTVEDIIIEFARGNYYCLVNKIPLPKEKNNPLLDELFEEKRFVYSYKRRGFWSLLFFIAMLSTLTIMYLLAIIAVFFSPIVILFIPFPLLLSFGIFYTFKIYATYKESSEGISIRITTGSSKFTLTKKNESKEFNKSDMKELRIYSTNQYKMPWGDYNFCRLIFNDKKTIDITFMIMDHWILESKFKGVPVIKIDKFYPYIDKIPPDNRVFNN
jgi:hypothetical protein